ncbi:putative oligomerization/nucleic acid binding protein [Halopolyspora algeriensis]|uniref:Putative oligomerization/nucleic acid binding protein n=1 Tax=Halopolyspora algeriensis TaxID=1500506 RepID=A0A368VQK4_9ACTN|nr:putative oligomerization/nucleic acid binding protein [Halopolyspora algeriensis]TQM56783.1 putative oligomerization/nucleic acid binding protein [Halopolyspora algeriensis]
MGEEKYPAHPGLAQAAARLKNVFGGKRDIRRLPKYLYADEAVGELAIGLYGGGFGVLALTDRRILYVYEGWVDSRSEDFPFDQVEGVHLKDKGRERSEIEIVSRGKKAGTEIENVNETDARRFVDAARKKLNRARKHSPKPNRPGPEAPARPASPAQHGSNSSTELDPLDGLERLGKLRDTGVLTEEEFATQKAKLLRRL